MRPRFLLQCIVAASIAVLPLASHAAQKTAKACESEWRANKASIQGSGKTKKAFMVECRSGTGQTAAAPAVTPPATSQDSTAQPPANAPATPRRTAREATPRPDRGTAVAANAGQFQTEAEAKARCPGQTVVWANTRSKVYHFAGSRSYGNTKRGAYMCERDTSAAGLRSAKNEKRPQ
jgi:hypothetical protein